jgi:hypothetical protein
MRTALEITTRPVPRGEDEIPQSEILLQGSPTGKLVNGTTLEAAVQWRDCYLLLMTNDSKTCNRLSSAASVPRTPKFTDSCWPRESLTAAPDLQTQLADPARIKSLCAKRRAWVVRCAATATSKICIRQPAARVIVGVCQKQV